MYLSAALALIVHPVPRLFYSHSMPKPPPFIAVLVRLDHLLDGIDGERSF